MKNRVINYSIALLILILCAGFIYPFLPSILFWLNPSAVALKPYPSVKSETQQAKKQSPMDSYAHTPYTVIVPRIGINTAISFEEDGYTGLKAGSWFVPGTANPTENGRMVLLGHRFEFLPPNNTTFYLLDKLQKGDIIYIYWENTEYAYTITGSKVVTPDEETTYIKESFRQNTKEIALITCTPLWTSAERLIVYGTQISTFQ